MLNKYLWNNLRHLYLVSHPKFNIFSNFPKIPHLPLPYPWVIFLFLDHGISRDLFPAHILPATGWGEMVRLWVPWLRLILLHCNAWACSPYERIILTLLCTQKLWELFPSRFVFISNFNTLTESLCLSSWKKQHLKIIPFCSSYFFPESRLGWKRHMWEKKNKVFRLSPYTRPGQNQGRCW